MKVGTKIYIKEDNVVGIVQENDHKGKPTKALVGDKIIDISQKTIKILTWLVELILLIKKFIK